jgi:PAS domain S-box-containing protein
MFSRRPGSRSCSLFENVAVGVVLVGSDGRFVEVNPAFCNMTGYSKAELRHLTPGDITHEDDRDATEGILTAQAEDLFSTLRIEKRYRRKDGGIIWAEVSVVMLPTMSRAQLRAAAVMIDITERKRAEAALRRSEAYLTEGQRLSRSGSFGWHVSRGDIFWSAETFKIFGYDQAPSANIDMVLKRVHPEDFALAQRVIAEASSSGRDFDFDHRLLMPDGSIKYVHVVGHAVRDQADELEFIGAVIDVTAAKCAEEELHKAQASLTHAARVMTLGELAASIAHEIRQPLAAIATNASAGLHWLAREPPDVEEVRACLQNTYRDSHRASDVMARIRSLIKKSPPVETSLDLNDAIHEVLSLIAAEARRHAVLVQAELADRMPRVRGDRVQLQQVILNLVMNGIDAMKDVAGRPRELWIRSHAHEVGMVRIAIEDTGIGLEGDSLECVFEAFYTTKEDGMGMGLSISRSIIAAHGGRLWPSANNEHGATFQFTLPTEDTYDRDTAEVRRGAGLAA